MQTYKCKNCGRAFESPRITRPPLHCSRACSFAGPKKTLTKVCKACGKEFSGTPSLLKRREYCSNACHQSTRKTKEQRVCEKCGKEFTTQKGRTGRYCSIECRLACPKDQIELKCLTCGNPFEVSSFRAKIAKYCSPECSSHGKRNGENNYRVLRVKGRYIKEHRYVMEQFLGRELFRHENVHHKNGDRGDNRLENLEVWSSSQPSGQRIADKLAHAREILALYENYRDPE